MEIARQTSALPYDPAPLGTASARRSLVDRLAAGHDPDDVCLAASTSELYRFLLDLLCDAGDNILVPAPGYPLFDMIGDLNGVELRFYPLLEADGWSIDLDALEAAVDSRTREIATLRTIGFSGFTAFMGTLIESLVLALLGGALAILVIYILFNGNSASTLGGGFTQIVFSFQVTMGSVISGLVLALAVGFLGGIIPGVRAARVSLLAVHQN